MKANKKVVHDSRIKLVGRDVCSANFKCAVVRSDFRCSQAVIREYEEARRVVERFEHTVAEISKDSSAYSFDFELNEGDVDGVRSAIVEFRGSPSL